MQKKRKAKKNKSVPGFPGGIPDERILSNRIALEDIDVKKKTDQICRDLGTPYGRGVTYYDIPDKNWNAIFGKKEKKA